MNILLIEPYYGGSHRVWADGYKKASRHDVSILSLPAQFWKWRMQGGAVTLARLFQQLPIQPDVILASDMFNLSTFRALTRQQTAQIPIALYFHENQLSYPQNERQKHGWRYGFINYVSALAADAVYFNSQFHRDDFFRILPKMLKHFGDHNELGSMEWLAQKTSVLPVGLHLQRLKKHRVDKKDQPPIILWNHRWESDKNPQAFFNALYNLDDEGFDFQVVLLGQNFSQAPQAFEDFRQRLAGRILHYGYVENFAAYARWLWRSSWVVSTAYHDFFGIATAEAIYCGCVPILPDRLNYPALVPDAYHEQCLYRGDHPEYLLQKHLKKEAHLSPEALQQHITQYDWNVVAAHYDDKLEALTSDRSPLSW